MRTVSSGIASGGVASPSLGAIFSPIDREDGPLLARSWSSQPTEPEAWVAVPATTEGFVYYWHPQSNQVSWVLPKSMVEVQLNTWAQGHHSELTPEHAAVEDRASGSRVSLNAKVTEEVQVRCCTTCLHRA